MSSLLVSGEVHQALPRANWKQKGEDSAGFNKCFVTSHICVPGTGPNFNSPVSDDSVFPSLYNN